MPAFKVFGIALAASLLCAQTPPPAAGPVASFTATTANLTGATDSIRIDILRWSTDAEREKLMAAWNKTGEPLGGNGRGGGRGAGRGGRGGRGGTEPSEAAPPATPEGSLAAALQEAATVGYLWSSTEVAGYALRYAGKLTGSNGVERVILITNRRLGALNDLWKPAGPGQSTTYDFSVIELRVNAKGEGEGKASLTGKVAPDTAAKMVALETYDALPVVLRSVKSRPASR
jgi:hypothetical protein